MSSDRETPEVAIGRSVIRLTAMLRDKGVITEDESLEVLKPVRELAAEYEDDFDE